MARSKKTNWGEVVKTGALAGGGAIATGFISKQIPEQYQKFSNFVPLALGAFLMTRPDANMKALGTGMFAIGAKDLAEEYAPDMFNQGMTGIDTLSPEEVDEMEMMIAEGMNGFDDVVNGYDDDDIINGDFEDDDDDIINGDFEIIDEDEVLNGFEEEDEEFEEFED